MADSRSDPDPEYPGLKACIEEALNQYFANLDGEKPSGRLYYLVQSEVEQALLERILLETGGNQRRAAELLGLNRNTLRKKIQEYGISTKQ
ncbi:helix-turn-helix domain-containing protein [Thiohalorhabdus sp. Cl-TMA]|uniref:Putative Fis-like DNA-binding protein n=1 Tax=Thiohalorhabdus methylotrophus TaxID=3242694 RepID=A0ABV4TSI6_9GAMM